jgi:circadian clock protein KaiC
MARSNGSLPKSTFKSVPLAKCGTGVMGLDEVLCGGYPVGRTTMISGGPGAGKTLLALQFLVRSAMRGLPGIFISFEETPEAIRTNAATLGWDLPALEREGLFFLIHAKLDLTAVTAGPISLSGLMAIIAGKAAAMGARQLGIDALDILMRRFEDSFRARDEISFLHEWLNEQQLTTLLSVKSNDDPEMSAQFSFLDYLSDCVVRLDHRVVDQISTRRLRVLKYRGSAFGSNEFPYVIGANGVALIPIAASHLAHRPLGEFQSTGNRELDAALGGGFRRSACILVAGSSGTGKTTLACTFVQAACRRGEKALFISFEESPEALASAVLSAGIDLEPLLRAGSLEFCASLPESRGADEHLFDHLHLIDALQPDHIVVDAISACHRMGSGKAAFDYCMRLVNVCKERGITCLLTNQMKDSPLGADLSGLGFASLVDTVIQLQYEATKGALCRKLVVLKARGSKNSPRFYELRITDSGIELGGDPPPTSDP